MLGFALPWMFGLSVLAAAVVAGLHLLSVRRPPELVLPTTRFVSNGDARAVARQPRPNDLRLLLLRVGALLCLGAALAGVEWQATQASTLRLVVTEGAGADTAAWRDSVGLALRDEDALVEVVFASGMARDPGVALVAATRRAVELVQRQRALTQVELTVVLRGAPLTYAGFEAWRAQWPGTIRIVRSPATPAMDTTPPVVQVPVTGGRDDAVAAAFVRRAVSALVPGARVVNIVRDDDGTLAMPGAGAESGDSSSMTVQWPRNGVPTGWRALARPDTVGALVSGGRVVVGPWERRAVVDDSLRAAIDDGSRVRALAWWGDGEVAAVERQRGTGTSGTCRREVGIAIPPGSDLLQSESARGLREVLTAPCGGVPATASATVASVAAEGSAAASAFRVDRARTGASDPWWLTPLLLGSALVLLMVEWWWRRQEVAA